MPQICYRHKNCQDTFPGLLLKFIIYVRKLNGNAFSHPAFPKLEAVPLAGVAVVLLFFVVSGWEAMGHSVHFIVNHRNLLLFILITLPGIPCLSVSTRLSHKFLDLSIAA